MKLWPPSWISVQNFIFENMKCLLELSGIVFCCYLYLMLRFMTLNGNSVFCLFSVKAILEMCLPRKLLNFFQNVYRLNFEFITQGTQNNHKTKGVAPRSRDYQILPNYYWQQLNSRRWVVSKSCGLRHTKNTVIRKFDW